MRKKRIPPNRKIYPLTKVPSPDSAIYPISFERFISERFHDVDVTVSVKDLKY